MSFSPDIDPAKVCKAKRGQWHLCPIATIDKNGVCIYARVTGHCMKPGDEQIEELDK